MVWRLFYSSVQWQINVGPWKCHLLIGRLSLPTLEAAQICDSAYGLPTKIKGESSSSPGTTITQPGLLATTNWNETQFSVRCEFLKDQLGWVQLYILMTYYEKAHTNVHSDGERGFRFSLGKVTKRNISAWCKKRIRHRGSKTGRRNELKRSNPQHKDQTFRHRRVGRITPITKPGKLNDRKRNPTGKFHATFPL